MMMTYMLLYDDDLPIFEHDDDLPIVEHDDDLPTVVCDDDDLPAVV